MPGRNLMNGASAASVSEFGRRSARRTWPGWSWWPLQARRSSTSSHAPGQV